VLRISLKKSWGFRLRDSKTASLSLMLPSIPAKFLSASLSQNSKHQNVFFNTVLLSHNPTASTRDFFRQKLRILVLA
jgi:hypothetical protein